MRIDRNLRFWLVSGIAFYLVLVVAAPAGGQEPVKCKRPDRPARGEIHYRMAKSYRTVESQAMKYPPTLVVFISVKARHFIRDDMLALAKQLSEDFCNEPRLGVFIFSDYAMAKRFTSSEESSDYTRSWRALRGHYNLDRAKGEEFIAFSTDPTTPQIQQRLELRVNPK